MAGEKEVKAQVKLRFYARNRVRMTATRNLMVTAKKTGQTMKTLESLLDAENPNSNKVGLCCLCLRSCRANLPYFSSAVPSLPSARK
jgi:hypothetical protein